MLSICVLVSENDINYLDGLIASLPEWAEVITVFTKKQDILEDRSLITAPRLYNVKKEGRFTAATYLWCGSFNFAKARNKALGLATTQWVLHLDPDERLMPYQHDYIKYLIEHSDQSVGAYINRNYSLIAGDKDQDGYMPEEVLRQVRLHRNTTSIEFANSIHESIEDSIIVQGLQIHDSQLFIHHLGYEIPKEKLQGKVERNIDSLLSEPQQLRSERGRKILNELFILKNKLEKQ